MTKKEVQAQEQQHIIAPSARLERLREHAGKGVSTDAADKFVPLVKVLQSQSPQCLKQRPEYVAGAEAGDFFLRNTLTPLIKGNVGLEFQPCAFVRCWLEFDGPREAKPQFLGRHRDVNGRPAEVKDLQKDETGFGFVDSRNHRFVFSREHYGLVDGHPFVIPFGGSGHTTSRNWQTLMDQFSLPDGGVEPSFNRKYKLTTTPKSNAKGDWYAVQVQALPGEVSYPEEFNRGLALYEAVMAGTKVAEAEEPNEEPPM